RVERCTREVEGESGGGGEWENSGSPPRPLSPSPTLATERQEEGESPSLPRSSSPLLSLHGDRARPGAPSLFRLRGGAGGVPDPSDPGHGGKPDKPHSHQSLLARRREFCSSPG